MSDAWYSAQQLAGLPGMPGHESNVRILAKKNLWPTRSKERGKGVEYPISALPQDARDALLARIAAQSPISPTAPVTSLPAAVPAGGPVAAGLFTPASQLKDWQRRTAEARAAIVGEVKRLAQIGGMENAIRTVIGLAATGSLPDHLQPLVTVANAKAGLGGSRALSRTSIYRWMKDAEAGFTGLAPKTRDDNSIPPWAAALLSLWQQPQKPTLAAALDRLHGSLPPHILPPSYSQARRFLEKMSARDREAGRMGSREIKNIRAYVKRDTSKMWPGDAYTADGHTLDAEVAHPAHGRAFRPELTTVIDIATRRAIGCPPCAATASPSAARRKPATSSPPTPRSWTKRTWRRASAMHSAAVQFSVLACSGSLPAGCSSAAVRRRRSPAMPSRYCTASASAGGKRTSRPT